MVPAKTPAKACAIIPAYDAERTVGDVVRALLERWPHAEKNASSILVIDDGSRDHTAKAAREAGARVLAHPENRGKGAALRTGMAAAYSAGFDVAVTVDADGQHPAEEAVHLLDACDDAAALVLGIRDLDGAGAPRANRISNRISNFFLSLFAGRALLDTQCGLRRYPLASTLALGGLGEGYAFEAEIILRAVAAGVPVVEVPTRVIYPPEHERVTHFHSVRDPARIIARIVQTLVVTQGMRRAPRPPRCPRRSPAKYPSNHARIARGPRRRRPARAPPDRGAAMPLPRWIARRPKKLAALATLLIAPLLAHAGIALSTRMTPPRLSAISGEAVKSPADPDLRVLGASYARHRGKILEVRLTGDPERIGHDHGRLLYPEMVENEGTLYAQFNHYVPIPPARWLLMDISRLQFRGVDQRMPEDRRREIAAQAQAFSPDPYDGVLPTYQRLVFLQSLYDIALSFEHSPLLGCTSFALTGDAAEDGHVLLARNFDF